MTGTHHASAIQSDRTDTGIVSRSFFCCHTLMKPQSKSSVHEPVLGAEVVEWLNPTEGGIYVDGTLGGAGHASLIASHLAANNCQATLIGLDRDSVAVEAAPSEVDGIKLHAIHSSYSDLSPVLQSLGLDRVDGILLDLGLSSDQLADDARGFSFDAPGELDLRFDMTRGEPAWKLVERLSERHLADLIYEFGEERLSRRIARDIVAARRQEEIRTAEAFANIVRRSVKSASRNRGKTGERIDPATRTFQALRIAVNEELTILQHALRNLPDLLSPRGRLLIISFHSLEDRLVKHHFRDDERLTVLTRKPIRPDDSEIAKNRRSRSSRMRVAERVAE